MGGGRCSIELIYLESVGNQHGISRKKDYSTTKFLPDSYLFSLTLHAAHVILAIVGYQ